MLWKSDGNDKFAFQIHPTRMDISRPEDVPNSQHLYPTTRLPVDMYRFTDANGMILVYNIDSRSSFDSLKHFIDARIQDSKSKNVEPKVLCVVGNKLDKSKDKRKILCLEGEALASKLGCPFVECSAKDQKGLDKVKGAVIKAMETQRSQLQYAQQQRDRSSRTFNQKTSLIRRLSGGNLMRSESQRSINSNEPNTNQRITRAQRHRNGAMISPSGRYKGGLLSSSLSSDDRIEEEDEETESDEKSRSSSQQSSNTSTASQQSGITITPPSNASSIRASFSHRLTIEKLPPTAMVSLSPVDEKPQGMVRSFSDLSLYSSTGMPKQNIESTATSSRLQYPQNGSHVQSLPSSRVQSPELVSYARSRKLQESTPPVRSFQLPQLKFSQPLSPTSDEKQKLEEERAELEKEKEKLKQEMEELQKHQIRLEERRKVEAERRAIEEERMKIVEERKRIEEERRNLKEAKRLLEEEDAQWRYEQGFPFEESSPEHGQPLDAQFRSLSPGTELRDDAKQEEIRRHHQEQLQRETQQELQLKSGTSSPSSAYSVQRESLLAHGVAPPTEVRNHPLRGNPISNPKSPQQRPTFSTRPSVLSPEENPAQLNQVRDLTTARLPSEKAEPQTASPPHSPDITQTFRRRFQKATLSKKEPKKEVSEDQRETLRFLRDELGIAMPQIPPSGPQPRSPRSLLLPPGTTIALKGPAEPEEKPRLPFPGRYI
jgi:hypothetical protein